VVAAPAASVVLAPAAAVVASAVGTVEAARLATVVAAATAVVAMAAARVVAVASAPVVDTVATVHLGPSRVAVVVAMTGRAARRRLDPPQAVAAGRRHWRCSPSFL